MIGETIRKLRLEQNLTVRELAEKSDITHSMVSNFENNIKVPGRKVLIKLAKALKVSEEDLHHDVRINRGDFEVSKIEYIKKLKLAESITTPASMTLISKLIDFALEKEKIIVTMRSFVK